MKLLSIRITSVVLALCSLSTVSGFWGQEEDAAEPPRDSVTVTVKRWIYEEWTVSQTPAPNPAIDSVTYLDGAKSYVAGLLGPIISTEEQNAEPEPSTTYFEQATKVVEDWKLAGTTAAAVAGSAVTSTLGTAAGFTAGGIVKGSLAASMQSYIGTGVIFSTLQSMGASGGMAMLGPAGLAGGAVAGVGYYFLG